jgi:hypothetical protein
MRFSGCRGDVESYRRNKSPAAELDASATRLSKPREERSIVHHKTVAINYAAIDTRYARRRVLAEKEMTGNPRRTALRRRTNRSPDTGHRAVSVPSAASRRISHLRDCICSRAPRALCERVEARLGQAGKMMAMETTRRPRRYYRID